MSGKDILNSEEIQSHLSQLPHWRWVMGSLRTAFKCPSSAAALEFLAAIGALAEESNHHPDVDWRYDTLFISLFSHDVGGVTSRDVEMAERITKHSEVVDVQAHLNIAHGVEIAVDTDDPGPIKQVWKAALGYQERLDDSLEDPYRRGPNIWFQTSKTPNENRLHVDVFVPHSHQRDTLDSLKAAGAKLDFDYAPSWVIATDAQGNRLCICTEAGRE